MLWRWAAGDDNNDDEALGKSSEQLEAEGRASGLKVFREGVLWYLGWRLQGAVELQRGMVEIRAAREREREKSVLYKMKTGAANTTATNGVVGGGQLPRRTAADTGGMSDDIDYKPSLEHSTNLRPDDSMDEDIPPHLLTLFATENSSLLQHYNSTLNKIAQAEKSLLDISSLQSTLLTHLSTQGEMIEQLVEDAQGTGEDVKRGNRELKKAGERWGRGLARGVFWGTVGLCGFLVGWDLVF